MPSRVTIALLLLAQALPAWSAGFPACVRKKKGKYLEPATLSALRRCQQILKDKHAALQRKKGFPMSAADQDALEDFQMEEVREYLGRHPGRATMDEGPNAAAPKTKKKKHGEAAEAPAENAPPQEGKEGAPPPGGQDQGGPAPEVVRGMIENLRMQMGDNPDLRDLQSAVEKDGPTLSPWTIRKLKAVARKAKLEGQDLNLSPEAEQWLLAD